MANPKSAYSVSTKKEKTDTHIIVVWVDNEAGVLARVVGLFSGRVTLGGSFIPIRPFITKSPKAIIAIPAISLMIFFNRGFIEF